jgi:hypothetical protein
MNIPRPTLAAAALALLASLPATAALELRPGGMVYDTDADLTWLLDWNAAAGGPYDNGSSPSDGRMSWANAIAWADALVWGGADDWRLPASDACFGFGCRGSEIGHLWYDVLGNVAGQPATSTAPFQNLMPAIYWTATQPVGSSGQAWYFNALGGSQNLLSLSAQAHAVAVRQGDVLQAVPEPATAWLALAGLGVAACVAQRRRAPEQA